MPCQGSQDYRHSGTCQKIKSYIDFSFYGQGFQRICNNTNRVDQVTDQIYICQVPFQYHPTFLQPQIRAISASLTWKTNLVSDDILRQPWTNHTTFTSFYLKDLSHIKDQLHSLGPLIAAQSVINL